jgi:hypothetical protein
MSIDSARSAPIASRRIPATASPGSTSTDQVEVAKI